MDSNEFNPNVIYNNSNPYYFMQGDTVIGRRPFDQAGTFQVEYYKQTPILVNDTDVIPIPMQAFTKAFVDYGVAMALHKDNKHNDAIPFEASAASQLTMFKKAIAPRNTTNTTMVNIVDSIGDDNAGGFW